MRFYLTVIDSIYFFADFLEPLDDLLLASDLEVVEADFAVFDDADFVELDFASDFPADFDEPEFLSAAEDLAEVFPVDFPADEDFELLDFAVEPVDFPLDLAAVLSFDFEEDFVDDDLVLEADFAEPDADFLPLPPDPPEDWAPDCFNTSSVAATTAPFTALFPTSARTSPAFAATLPTAVPTVSTTPLSELFPFFVEALFLPDDCFVEGLFAASFFAIFSLLVH